MRLFGAAASPPAHIWQPPFLECSTAIWGLILSVTLSPLHTPPQHTHTHTTTHQQLPAI